MTPSLFDYLSAQEIRELANRKLFGGYDVPFLPIITLGLWTFCKGAVLGRARHAQLSTLAKMFVGALVVRTTLSVLGVSESSMGEPANDEANVLLCLRKLGPDGLEYYEKERGKQPDSFIDLWRTSFTPGLDFADVETMKRLSKTKLRLGHGLELNERWGFAGLSLGAAFPDLVEKLWRESFETADQDKWTFARQSGVDIPEQFTPMPLKDMEQLLLLQLASYVTEYYRELVEPLALSFPKGER